MYIHTRFLFPISFLFFYDKIYGDRKRGVGSISIRNCHKFHKAGCIFVYTGTKDMLKHTNKRERDPTRDNETTRDSISFTRLLCSQSESVAASTYKQSPQPKRSFSPLYLFFPFPRLLFCIATIYKKIILFISKIWNFSCSRCHL